MQDYLEQHPAAAGRTHAVGIDREAMAVVVYWFGQRLDPLTDAAFTAMTQQTGIPITIVCMAHSPADIRIAKDQVWSEQEGVRRVGYDVLTEALEVGVAEYLHGRPNNVVVNGATVPVRYRLSDLQPLVRPTPAEAERPRPSGTPRHPEAIISD